MKQSNIKSFLKSNESSATATSQIQPSTPGSSNDVNIVNVNNDFEEVDAIKSVNRSDIVAPAENFIAHFRPEKSFEFPKSKFGNRDRRCQHQWFQDFKWLHYDVRRDCVFCFHCLTHEHH